MAVFLEHPRKQFFSAFFSVLSTLALDYDGHFVLQFEFPSEELTNNVRRAGFDYQRNFLDRF